MKPERLVQKILGQTNITFNIVADEENSSKVKVTKVVGNYRYTIKYNQEDDTKVLLFIKDINSVNEHRSKQNTKKSLNMVLAHIGNPTPAFKLLYRVQEASD